MKIALILILFVSNAMALETDNYISWGKDLRDSRLEINQYFATEIENVLRTHDGKNKSCGEITFAIAKNFKSIGVSDNPVENYMIKTLKHDQFYPHTFEYVSESIYRKPFLPHVPKFGLSPNIQVNGFYLGTDKLSHFASTGYTYYLIYSASKNRGEEEALNMAIAYGVKDEQSLHGYWASGVFSYADLEANFQGLMFYRRLCGEENSYLSQDLEGHWKLTLKPDFADYVSGDWDESWRRSYFVSKNWKKVSPVLETYCGSAKSDRVKARINFYKSHQKKSFTYYRLEELKRSGDAPDPEEQSFEKLCAFQNDL